MISEPRHFKNQVHRVNGCDLLYDNGGRSVPRAAIIFKRGFRYLPLFQFVTPDLVAAEIKSDFDGNSLNVVVASGYHDGNCESVPIFLK